MSFASVVIVVSAAYFRHVCRLVMHVLACFVCCWFCPLLSCFPAALSALFYCFLLSLFLSLSLPSASAVASVAKRFLLLSCGLVRVCVPLCCLLGLLLMSSLLCLPLLPLIPSASALVAMYQLRERPQNWT